MYVYVANLLMLLAQNHLESVFYHGICNRVFTHVLYVCMYMFMEYPVNR